MRTRPRTGTQQDTRGATARTLDWAKARHQQDLTLPATPAHALACTTERVSPNARRRATHLCFKLRDRVLQLGVAPVKVSNGLLVFIRWLHTRNMDVSDRASWWGAQRDAYQPPMLGLEVHIELLQLLLQLGLGGLEAGHRLRGTTCTRSACATTVAKRVSVDNGNF